MLQRLTAMGAVLGGAMACTVSHADWKPADAPVMTEFAKSVSPDNAWPEYPRPQLVRDNWTNLNGLWDYAVTPLDVKAAPQNWDGEILVPFALESALSGVGKRLNGNQVIWYHRSFDPQAGHGERVLLNFEAVDYACEVFVNGQSVGKHIGGNLPFSFDVTDALKDGQDTIAVRVEDFTDDANKYQLRGKQVRNNRGIWYTPVSGIWQTVWTETVPATHIESIKIDTQIDPAIISVAAQVTGRLIAGHQIRVTVKDGDKTVASVTARDEVMVPVADAKLWSPDSPNLYDLVVEVLNEEGQVLDSVESYAGIREVGEMRDPETGTLRFTLNGEPIFHWGPLDQGWWPDGLLTPPSDEAMVFDVDYLKAAGFNMIRKHIKVEPRRYYAYCDKVGMMVWQDQPSGGRDDRGGEWPRWTRLRENHQQIDWPDWAHEQYMVELKDMVDTLYNSPSIVCWVPFNEAWGQHRTVPVGEWITEYDPTRHINIASGGNFYPVGDIVDAHAYPHPSFPFNDARFMDYIMVVGEFGGHGFPVEGHKWSKEAGNWGYGGLPKDEAEYMNRFKESLRILNELKSEGVAAGVYTQTTDVEVEINGLMTYDRQVIKIPAEVVNELSQPLLAE